MSDLTTWMSTLQQTVMSFPGSEHSFVSGSAAHRPIKVTYRKCAASAVAGTALAQHIGTGVVAADHDEQHVVLLAEYRFTQLCQGPPGHAHGGSIAAALDELMGGAGWINGFAVLARKIEVDFVKPVKIDWPYFGCAVLATRQGRKLSMKAVVLDAEGVLVSSSQGLFIEIERDKLQTLLGVAG